MTEFYKGIPIEISTVATKENTWTSQAEYKVEGNSPVRLILDGMQYSTQAEAQQAALQTAVENIDRNRVSRGKP